MLKLFALKHACSAKTHVSCYPSTNDNTKQATMAGPGTMYFISCSSRVVWNPGNLLGDRKEQLLRGLSTEGIDVIAFVSTGLTLRDRHHYPQLPIGILPRHAQSWAYWGLRAHRGVLNLTRWLADHVLVFASCRASPRRRTWKRVSSTSSSGSGKRWKTNGRRARRRGWGGFYYQSRGYTIGHGEKQVAIAWQGKDQKKSRHEPGRRERRLTVPCTSHHALLWSCGIFEATTTTVRRLTIRNSWLGYYRYKRRAGRTGDCALTV